jgi:hypothetical protein
VLGAAVALDARVREGVPVPLAIGEARHLLGQELIQRLCHWDSSSFLRTICPGGRRLKKAPAGFSILLRTPSLLELRAPGAQVAADALATSFLDG